MKNIFTLTIISLLAFLGTKDIVRAEIPETSIEQTTKNVEVVPVDAWYSIRTNQFSIEKVKAKVIETYWEDNSNKPFQLGDPIDEKAYLIIDGKEAGEIKRGIHIYKLDSRYYLMIRSTASYFNPTSRALEVSDSGLHSFKKIIRTKTTTDSTGKTTTSVSVD